MLLKDKVVIITGIGPGLGGKLAIEAAQEGAKVVMAARSTDLMHSVASQICDSGGAAVAVQADISSDEDCARIAKTALEAHGRIDGLVNSAYRPGALLPVEALDLDDFRQSFDVTVIGTLRMIRAVLPAMKSQQSGSIVNIGTQVTRKHLPGQGGYAATKAALACLSRQLALELGPFGIRVNTPVLGWMWGAPVEGYLRDQEARTGAPVQAAVDAIAANIALGRIPPDQACARSVLLFLSDYMSEVTGATLDINGGEYMAL